MWKIVEINNATNKYKVQRHSGHMVNIAIPEQHKGEVTGKAYVSAVCDAHEAVIFKALKSLVLKCCLSSFVSVLLFEGVKYLLTK